MSGRRTHKTIAQPKVILFNESQGYRLVVNITEGPTHMLGRQVVIELTSAQLQAIADYGGEPAFLDLELICTEEGRKRV